MLLSAACQNVWDANVGDARSVPKCWRWHRWAAAHPALAYAHVSFFPGAAVLEADWRSAHVNHRHYLGFKHAVRIYTVAM